MNCTEIAPLLEDLLGGEIPEEAEGAVRAHLARCPGCRRAWEWMCVTREAFQALPPERPRGGFEQRLGERLGIEIGPLSSIEPPRPAASAAQGFLASSLALCRRQPGLQWALAASVLAAALGGGIYLKAPLPAGIEVPVPVTTEMAAPWSESAPRDQVTVPAPIAAPARPAPERRAALSPVAIRPKARPIRDSAPPSPLVPQPERLTEADPVAGLDATPMLGYVRAQDLPSPLRCQMGGSWPDCRLETACQRPDECGAAAAPQDTITTD